MSTRPHSCKCSLSDNDLQTLSGWKNQIKAPLKGGEYVEEHIGEVRSLHHLLNWLRCARVSVSCLLLCFSRSDRSRAARLEDVQLFVHVPSCGSQASSRQMHFQHLFPSRPLGGSAEALDFRIKTVGVFHMCANLALICPLLIARLSFLLVSRSKCLHVLIRFPVAGQYQHFVLGVSSWEPNMRSTCQMSTCRRTFLDPRRVHHFSATKSRPRCLLQRCHVLIA